MWRKSRFKLIENKKNDLMWLLIHRAIRVRYVLKLWGYINSDRCAMCYQVETIEHCFLECPRVFKLWGYFTLLLSVYSAPLFLFLLNLFIIPSLVPSPQPVFNFSIMFWLQSFTGAGLLIIGRRSIIRF